MRVSWNWISEIIGNAALASQACAGPEAREFLGRKIGGPKGLADLLTARGLEVEAMQRMDEGFDKVVTVQILERNKHPEADRLSLCKVTLGSGDPLEIVCGAQNMKAGDRVALAQIGASLPNGVKIAKSKIRGVESNGMLCSEQELKLADTSEGIMILPLDTPLGRPLAEILGLDDTIMTLKLTANRGDCLSHFGLAREIAGAVGVKLEKPAGAALDWKGTAITVSLEAGDAAPQFLGVQIEGVKIGPSPEWVRKRLETLGARAINNVVDATNLVMFELGHPVHAYDFDRIEGKALGVRAARAGESLPLLDGTTIQLAGTELVIHDGARAVGLAGVMGGGNSEVQDSTTRLFLECAEFDPILVRRAGTAHQKRTESSHRFERSVDPEGLEAVMRRLVEYVLQFAGGKVAGSVAVRRPCRALDGRASRERIVRCDEGFINRFLGTKFSDSEQVSALEQAGCRVAKEAGAWKVSVPSYRLDLSIREDLAEEVARIQGYDKIPTTVPPLSSMPATSHAMTVLLRAKEAMAQAGLLETLNFGFTSGGWLTQLGLSSTAKVVNPLSEEHEFMVPSLLPGLVANALSNWRHHFGSEGLAIRLFEIRPTFHAVGEIKVETEMKTTVEEKWKLAFAISGPRQSAGLRNEQGEVDFFDAKAVLELLWDAMGTRGLRLQALGTGTKGTASYSVSGLFHPGQSAEIVAGNRIAGVVGLLHPRYSKALKARAPLWLCELDWDQLTQFSRKAEDSRQFKGWPEFPAMERDYALLVASDVTADRITQIALKAGKPLAKSAKVFDVYQGAQVAEGKTSVAVRVTYWDESRSLQESETETCSQQIVAAWKKELAAEQR